MDSFLLFFPIVTVLGFVVASYFDLKTREIPQGFSYGLIAIGLIGSAFVSFLTENAMFAVQSVTFCILCFLFAYALYGAGIWAGGDVKLFAALGALLPAFGVFQFFPFLALGVSLIAVLPFSILYGGWFFARNKKPRKEIADNFKIWLKRSFYSPFYLLSAFFICLLGSVHWIVTLPLSAVFIRAKLYALPVVAFFSTWFFFDDHIFFLEYFIYILLVSAIVFLGIASYKGLKKHALRETVKVKNLEEGMIPVVMPRLQKLGIKNLARGLAKKEISVLKKSKIKEIVVRKSLPFTPILTLGVIILLFASLLI